MATIVLPYTPADGAPLSTSGWNDDLWSLTDGTSIYGELNGNIEDENFDVGELLATRHIRDYEGFTSQFDGATDTVDFHQFLFGLDANDNDWAVVPGASTRVYLGWAPTAAVLRASCFVTNFRMREGPADGQDPVDDGPNQYVALFVDGVRVAHTLRPLPLTHFPFANPGDANFLQARENVLSHHFDFVHMSGAMGAGWHDVDIRVLVPQNQGREELYPLYDTDAAAKTTHSVTHRVRGGIRSASIIGLF